MVHRHPAYVSATATHSPPQRPSLTYGQSFLDQYAEATDAPISNQTQATTCSTWVRMDLSDVHHVDLKQRCNIGNILDFECRKDAGPSDSLDLNLFEERIIEGELTQYGHTDTSDQETA